jgi:hypothetical protein
VFPPAPVAGLLKGADEAVCCLNPPAPNVAGRFAAASVYKLAHFQWHRQFVNPRRCVARRSRYCKKYRQRVNWLGAASRMSPTFDGLEGDLSRVLDCIAVARGAVRCVTIFRWRFFSHSVLSPVARLHLGKLRGYAPPGQRMLVPATPKAMASRWIHLSAANSFAVKGFK